jgi:hypothetical protein
VKQIALYTVSTLVFTKPRHQITLHSWDAHNELVSYAGLQPSAKAAAGLHRFSEYCSCNAEHKMRSNSCFSSSRDSLVDIKMGLNQMGG